MKYLRWIIALIVVVYVGWIAFPVVKSALTPGYDPAVPMRKADIDTHGGGPSITTYDTYGMDAEPMPAESIQGETAVAAIETDNKPVIWLWGAVIVFYLIAAFLFAKGNVRAALAYGAAFVADVVLTFLTKGEAGSGLFDRILEILSGWDPRYTLTLVALVLGFIFLMARGRPLPRRHLSYES